MSGDIGVFIGTDGLRGYAANVASGICVRGGRSAARISGEILSALSDICARARALSEKSAAGRAVPKAEEWLLDNWYLAEREGKGAARELRHAGWLPASRDTGRAVVSEAAEALVLSGRGVVTEKRAAAFLEGFQSVSALTEAELAAFLPAVTAELIFFLRSECRGVGGDNALLLENAFTSLRLLGGLDAAELLQNASLTETALRRDPTGEYAGMDDDTRAMYRREVSRIARRGGLSESEVARAALSLAEKSGQHIGRYIFTSPLGVPRREKRGDGYIAANVLISVIIALLLGIASSNAAVAVLTLFSASETVRLLIDAVITRVCPPRRVPGMELKDGVPEEGKTVCAVSFLLTSEAGAHEIASALEGYMLSNRDAGKNVLYAVLSDLPEASSETDEKDASLINAGKSAVDELNGRYGGGFYFLCRGREYSKTDGVWMARERKRGAILELSRLLCGEKSSLRCISGDRNALIGARYIIALDADTRLTPGAARELVGAALHPLNRPTIDKERGVVIRGHAVLRPRVGVDIAAADRSDFARLFAGAGGVDPYGCLTSDVYQDIYGLGSFAGKGIIDARAYLDCLSCAFPDGTVLSHDLLEGAYLRSAYISGTELTDGYPYKLSSYFARMDRWVRGDWQSAPWLLRGVKNASGKRAANPLSTLDRWKIFDNLRRSLVPVGTFLSILLAFLLPEAGLPAAAAAAGISLAADLLLSSLREPFRRGSDKRARYHSTVIYGFPAWLMQTLCRLSLLPYEAFVCARAAVTALWRMCVTRRNMLQWVTSADSERASRDSAVAYLILMWPSALLGAITLALTPYAPAAALGAVWLVSPFFAWSLSRERKRGETPPRGSEELLGAARDIRRYFDEMLTAEDNWLPPDNWQENPPVGTAHRTSPTNIGLALLSALAACDLGLLGRDDAVAEAERLIGTVERMRKWRGHLYNWYDTRTLKVLRPACVSSVDSGNLAACFAAAENGFKELCAPALAARCRALMESMDFSPLYDERRRLFYIGWDAERSEPVDGHYDLLESEARLLSYFAVARGYAPRKHWRALGRALVSADGYSGLSSWTGTMFEYLMPDLLLPCRENTLLWESRAFCVYVQRRRAAARPWGESESAYFAFDPALSYKYKAHGAPRLALKRGMEADSVVSPYSSFLALAANASAAMSNLRELRRLGVCGKYGYYEALDYTPSRMREGVPETVKTYMAHHLGMSLVAIDNALCAGVMRKRFMSNPEMAAYSCLLEEKVPLGEARLSRISRDVPEKPPRAENAGWAAAGRPGERAIPAAAALSNGACSALFREDGVNTLSWGETLLARAPGVMLALVDGENVLTLTGGGAGREFAFTGHAAGFSAESGGARISAAFSISPDERGFSVTARADASGAARDAEICLYFEPALAGEREYEAHPSFVRLMLEARLFDGALTVTRRGKNAAIAVACDLETSFETSRLRAFGRAGAFSVRPRISGNEPSASPEICVLASAKIRLLPGASAAARFAVAVGESAETAASAAARVLRGAAARGVSRLDGGARLLGLDAAGVARAMNDISAMEYCRRRDAALDRLLGAGGIGRRSLWRFGISGDLPLLTASVSSTEGLERARELVRCHELARENGYAYDLAFLLSDGGDYRRSQRTAITDILRAVGGESTAGQKGGVHMIDDSLPGAEAVTALSRLHLDLSSQKLPELERIPLPELERPSQGDAPEYGYLPDGAFWFEVRGRLPETAWQHIITNGRMGYLATDAGTGNMWLENAREHRINHWINDALAVRGPEDVRLLLGEKSVSLFAREDGYPCRVTYGFGFAVWEKTADGVSSRMTAFITPDADVRALLIEIEGAPENARIEYSTSLALGTGERFSPYPVVSSRGAVTEAVSPDAEGFPGAFRVTAGAEPLWHTPDGASEKLRLEWSLPGSLVIAAGTAGADELLSLTDVKEARASLDAARAWWDTRVRVLRVRTPSAELDAYLNGWALYQTLACRVMGRTSMYQSGGAYGFRDQLQDVTALCAILPEITRAQIIRAASRQYEEGDVLHWWHETAEGPMGVRTRCTDDLLWLPYALCEYVETTGDAAFCDTSAPYIRSPELAEDERERCETPERSRLAEPLLRHAERACEAALRRGAGEHGLCLIGTGDWNDGFSAVGAKGRGESVWLTWFLSLVLNKMSRLTMRVGDGGTASRYKRESDRLRAAASEAWDGGWFLRGYFDDGSPVGAASCGECRIDSVAQSFAVFAGEKGARTDAALRAAVESLLDEKGNVTALFTPPFSDGGTEPGYIKSYAPGFRENGGQYTHAAVWLALALFENGMPDDGWRVLRTALPGGRDEVAYKTEPYAVAADIYTQPQSIGRGGWTWYTGAAGWLFRAAVEGLLGIRVRDGSLTVSPSLPGGWDGFEAELTGRKIVARGGELTVDGERTAPPALTNN